MTSIFEVIAPSSDQSIVADVIQYLQTKKLGDTELFEHFDDAVRAVWPALQISNPYAALLVSINVYLVCAEMKGFKIKPDFLKTARRDGLL